MNYRHSYHAGNHADVLKHTIMLALLQSLKRKETPFFVLDTHAGRGRYALNGTENQTTRESDGGIIKLTQYPHHLAIINDYLNAINNHNSNGELSIYPGSPLLIADSLRPQDRFVACELNEQEVIPLRQLLSKDSRVTVHHTDGYRAIKAFLPPKHGAIKLTRGLVIIDPPYEQQNAEYPIIIQSLVEGLTRWPNGMFAVWYPIKQRRLLHPFFRKIAQLTAKSIMSAELYIRPDDSPLRLNGSGMLLINTPWQFETVLTPLLPLLKNCLGENGAFYKLDLIKMPQ